MSIYIKEYITFLIAIGIIKIISPNDKIKYVLKFFAFSAMIIIVVFPFIKIFKSFNFQKNSASYKSSAYECRETSMKYADYFSNILAHSYNDSVCKDIEQQFKNAMDNCNITTYQCKALYNGKLCLTASVNQLPYSEILDEFKQKYTIEKINIRLVNANAE